MLLRKMMVMAAVVAISAGLGACREEERNRPLSYEKGTYTGAKGSPLSSEQLRALRQRHQKQAGGGL